MLPLLSLSCKRSQPLNKIFQKQTARERYEQSLVKANLTETTLGQKWISAGQRVLKDSLLIVLPFQETGFFSSETPGAVAYRLMARRGEVLTIHITTIPDDFVLFADFFEVESSNPLNLEHLVSADTTEPGFSYEIKNDGLYLLRLQPELLQGGQYTITMSSRGALSFPVQSKDTRNIGSLFGVDREGGRRRHEGVDIFSARGTPALSAIEGTVSRINTNRLGGKVVWLRDRERRQTLYYAHLDSQMVSPGQKVFPGDTVGLIGNTGNAITTPPHLHFGIYSSGEGAIDPFPFINTDAGELAPILANKEAIGHWYRTKSTSNIRKAPSVQAGLLQQVEGSTPLFLHGVTDNWYRIALPDGTSGYIFANLIEAPSSILELKTIDKAVTLFTSPQVSASPMARLESKSQVEVLGNYGPYLWVRNEQDKVGWISNES